MKEELLHLEDITIRHDEHIVLRDASLTLRNGEFVYVIGKVGSGKSSLLKSLYCEIPIQEGQASKAACSSRSIVKFRFRKDKPL